MTDFDAAPCELDQVVDPSWLTTVFARRWPGVVIRQATIVETLVTQATKIRLALEGENIPQDAPLNVCIKGVFAKTDVSGSASIIETLFYRELASRTPVRVPRCIHAELNAAADNGVIVMHDLVAEGAAFLTALSPVSAQDAHETLDVIARLHAAGWQGKGLFGQSFVPRFLDQIGSKPILPTAMLQDMLNGPRGDPLPASVKDADRLQKALEALANQVRSRPSCLVHGDAHAGNVYRTADGFGLVDWQILQKGEWAQDVAYHLAAILTPDDRRRHERALLDHYRDRLRAFGGPDLPAEDAWTRYRAAMIYGFYLWSITRKVEPAITNEFVRRLGLAVDELQSFAVVGA